MSVAVQRSRQREQPAAGALPLVIGSLWLIWLSGQATGLSCR
jgi:hypothetical protein